ncbi:MAG TPA: serine hydrolase [Verrucomicrobiae bacterium]
MSFSSRGASVFPEKHWTVIDPNRAGLVTDKLELFQKFVGGRGCIIRHGNLVFTWGDQTKSSDVASAFKPLLTTLLFIAIHEDKIPSLDSKVSDFEPRLKELGKDAVITWRHLANQISGYGLTEHPGRAYSYNDFALALYYDILIGKVFASTGDEVLRTRLAEPLGFEDRNTFNAFGLRDRPGRLSLSVRDFARFGLLYLQRGKWRDKQLLPPQLIDLALSNPLPPQFPLTTGHEAAMLPNQRSIGGSRNITAVGPGYYSFNWWLNKSNALGQKLFVDAPTDTYLASGHGGQSALWIFPAWDMIVSWNDSPIDDHDKSPGNRDSKCNMAIRLLKAALKSE